MMVYIKCHKNGDITIHKNHCPRAKGDVLNVFINRAGDRVYEYTSVNNQSSR